MPSDPSIERIIRQASTNGLASPKWPALDPIAYHGIVGEFVLTADPYTEADPVAVLGSVLAYLGTLIGRGPHMVIGNERHSTNLFVTIVGQSAKGGKGTSRAVARDLAVSIEPDFKVRQLNGFGSGEAIVDAVRDANPDDPKDFGIPDKRLLVAESEMARMLKVVGRENSTLSQMMRDGFDGSMIQTRSRAMTAVATEHHIGVLAHIVQEELWRCMGDSDVFGGYANRFVWLLAKKSKLIPHGGNVPAELIECYAAKLRSFCDKGTRRATYERSDFARKQWETIYQALNNDDPNGRLGAVIARSAPICSRLALLFAVLDGSRVIDEEHDAAAYALWRYARESAAVIFADPVADVTADPKISKLLTAINKAGPEGLNLSQQMRVFNNTLTAQALESYRCTLEAKGLIETAEVSSKGRPSSVSRAITAKDADLPRTTAVEPTTATDHFAERNVGERLAAESAVDAKSTVDRDEFEPIDTARLAAVKAEYAALDKRSPEAERLRREAAAIREAVGAEPDAPLALWMLKPEQLATLEAILKGTAA